MTNELERALHAAAGIHLTDVELIHCLGDRPLGPGAARLTAHLDTCRLCRERLALLAEGTAPAEPPPLTPGEAALIRRLLQETPIPPRVAASTIGAPASGASPAPASVTPRPVAAPATLTLRENAGAAIAAARAPLEVGWQRIVATIPIPVWSPSRAHTESGSRSGLSPEGGWSWTTFVEEETGELSLTLSTRQRSFRGRRVRIRAGDWVEEATLLPLGEEEVGVEVFLPQTVWEVLPEEAGFAVELLAEE
ncbi:MAG: hypothetical protein FJX77_06765 [Armatimonadetes bacterium]|nr:hypothetical protein [Armatimonadota bacterium]